VGQHTNLYPRIILQFIRVAPPVSNYGFELVTWWQEDATHVKDFRVEIEDARPTNSNIIELQKKGSVIIIDRYTNNPKV